MNKILKYITGKTLQPMLVKYLSKTRIYQHHGIMLEIPPSVFHPAFFFSTKILLQYVKGMNLSGRSFLELGAGSGLIAFSTAQMGAIVTATDINPVAIEYLSKNSVANNIPVKIILSDLFNSLGPCQFDIIAINPPYYKKQPVSNADYAWYCGPESEYFMSLFKGLREVIHKRSEVIMVLSDECHIAMITAIAENYKFRLDIALVKNLKIEQLFIYKIINNFNEIMV